MKFREGEDVVIARSVYKCGCGSDHGRFYHGGGIEEIGLKSQGRIIKVDSPDKLLLRLRDGREWWLHPDELDLLDNSQIAKLRRLHPEMKDLPRHPVFEIAEQTPVFLVGDKVYSLGEGTPREGENFYEQTERKGIIKKLIRGKKITRTSLIEVGDFGYLESLTLDRGQLQLEKIGESYVKEVQKDFLGRLEGDLDVPQLIYKHVFPYLRDGEYRDKVFELIGLEENRAVVPGPQIKTEVTKNLEQIADEIGVKVEGLIRRIEEEGASYTGTSLLGKALNGKAVAIVDGVVYNLVTPNDRYDKHVQIDGQRFSLVEREQKKPKQQEFAKGVKVKIKRSSRYASQNEGMGTVEGNFGDENIGGVPCAKVKFEDGYLNSYRKADLEFAEEVFEGEGQSPKDLEDRFLTELGKKVRVDALRQHLSRDKVIDILRTQDPELLAIAGKKEHREEGFGFTFKNGRYYVYLEVPAFAIKSQFDGNHYLFDKTRIGINVWKDKGTIRNYDELVMIDNNNHPFLHNNSKSFARLCTGELFIPTSGRNNGEIVAKRLRRGVEMLMFGYTKDRYYPSFELRKDGGYFNRNLVEESELKKLNIPIIQGGKRQ
jgi:hypothetical protein